MFRRLLDFDKAFHARIAARYPTALERAERFTRGVHGLLSSPISAVFLTAVFAVLVVAGVRWTVIASITVAWLAVFIGLTRTQFVTQLTISTKLLTLVICGLAFAWLGTQFGDWALDQYRKTAIESNQHDEAKNTPANPPAVEPPKGNDTTPRPEPPQAVQPNANYQQSNLDLREPVLDLAIGTPFGSSTALTLKNSGPDVINVSTNLRCFILRTPDDATPMMMFTGFPAIDDARSWWTIKSLETGKTATKEANKDAEGYLHNKDVSTGFLQVANPKMIFVVDVTFQRRSDLKRFSFSRIAELFRDTNTGNPFLEPRLISDSYRHLLESMTAPDYRGDDTLRTTPTSTQPKESPQLATSLDNSSDALNIRIETPGGIAWPETSRVEPVFHRSIYFVTDIINLSSNRPVILDFLLIFKFIGPPVIFQDMPLENNMFMTQPRVNQVGAKPPLSGLRIEPLQNVSVYVEADIPKNVPTMTAEILFIAQDRISNKKIVTSLELPWSDQNFLHGIQANKHLFLGELKPLR